MISILVTVYNEERLINRTISSIFSQIDPFDCEIVIVASGCTDNTIPILEDLKSKKRELIVIREDKRTGKANAINIAKYISKGNILVLCDGDVLLGKNALKKIIAHFNDPKIIMASARVIPQNSSRTFISQISHQRCLAWHNFRKEQMLHGENVIPSGYLYAIRKGFLSNIPQNIINDDLYIGLINKQNIFKSIYVPDACVYPIFPTNYLDYYLQRLRTQLGRVQLETDFPCEVGKIKREYFNCLMSSYYSKHKFGKLALTYNCLHEIVISKEIEHKKNNLNIAGINLWEPIQTTKIQAIS